MLHEVLSVCLPKIVRSKVLLCSGCRVGTTFQGKYSDSIKGAYVYPSSNFLDDSHGPLPGCTGRPARSSSWRHVSDADFIAAHGLFLCPLCIVA